MALIELDKDQSASQFIGDVNSNIEEVGGSVSVSADGTATALVGALNGVFEDVDDSDELSADDSASDFVDKLNGNFEAASDGGTTRTVRVYDLMSVQSINSNQGRFFDESNTPVPVSIVKGRDYVIDKCECADPQLCDVRSYSNNTQKQQLIDIMNFSPYGGSVAFGAPVKATEDANKIMVKMYVSVPLKDRISMWHEEVISTPPESAWEGKKWLLFGDSITTEHADVANYGYGELTARQLLMQRENLSLSGRTTAQMYPFIAQCTGNYDVITVLLGTNDQGYGVEIGTLIRTKDGETLPSSIDDAYNYYQRIQMFYAALKTKWPNAVIAFIVPPKRYHNDGSLYVNPLSTEPYADAVINICEYYGIPCIDIHHDTATYTAISGATAEDRQMYFFNADGTHPNELGHATFIVPKMVEFFKTHNPNN